MFHRAKKAATRSKVVVEQPELSIDDPELSLAEKISKLRVQTLVREFLGAQELQLLGEAAMSSAIETFVEKDDTHAIQKYLTFLIFQWANLTQLSLVMLRAHSRKWLRMSRSQETPSTRMILTKR